jgi:glucose uptake protein
MILPASQGATLALLVISLICWGSWANTLKLAGKWRYELYYYDFALGFALLAAVAAFTAGSFNSSELTFQENFLITGYRNMAYVVAAGVIFNLGNMLLAATISLAGLAMAFAVTFAVALSVSTAWALIFEPPASMLLAIVGAALLLAALVLAAYSYSHYLDARADAVKKAALQVDPRAKAAKRPPQAPGAARAVVLGVVGGLALGLFGPLLDAGRLGEGGVAPYGLALLFAAGIFISTIVLGPFFVNFPVSGGPIAVSDYFKGAGKQHLLGLLGGILAGTAFLASMLALAAPAFLRTAPMPSYALNQGGPVLAGLWGLFVWREFKDAGERTQLLFMFTLILLAGGIGLLAVARR